MSPPLSFYSVFCQHRQEIGLQSGWSRWSLPEVDLLMEVMAGWWSRRPSSLWASLLASSRTLASSFWTSRVTLESRPAPPRGSPPLPLPCFILEVHGGIFISKVLHCFSLIFFFKNGADIFSQLQQPACWPYSFLREWPLLLGAWWLPWGCCWPLWIWVCPGSTSQWVSFKVATAPTNSEHFFSSYSFWLFSCSLRNVNFIM